MDLIGAHLQESGVLPREIRSGPHHDRAIIRLTERLQWSKNDMRHKRSSDLMNSVCLHNKALLAAKRYSLCRSTIRQKQSFCRNPWKFAQAVCRPSETVSPNFSAEQSLQYFESTISSAAPYSRFPDWISDVWQLPELASEFKCPPFACVKLNVFLRKCSSTSAPDVNNITYFHLKKLPCSHSVLATLYSKILLHSHSTSQSWCQGKTILLYKKMDANLPKNFRPITLTSVIGKLFHRILSLCLEEFALSNKLLDSSVQKGFLYGINGTMEHIFSIDSLLTNARSFKKVIVISFLDLKNTFGSVCHLY